MTDTSIPRRALLWSGAAAAFAPAALAERPTRHGKKTRKSTQKAPPVSPKTIVFEKNCHDPSKILHVAAVGDVLLHDMLQKWAARQKEGFYTAMAPVQDLIRGADIAFANLEGPAAEGVASNGKAVRPPSTRYDGHVYRGYPMFNYHPSIVTDLKRMGFRILLTANNHALDRHQLGIDRTIEAIKRAGLAFTGTRSRDDMSAPWYAITPVTAAGGTFRIAWLGATYGTNGIPDKAHQVLHCYDQREEVLELIRTLAKRPDLNAVIFTPHWGIEYQTKPDARQIALAHDAIDAGATAVIGTHPHVVQPLEKYTTKDGREALIAYSLGNFISNQIGLPRLSEPLLLLGLTPGEHGKLQVARVGWIPLHMRTHGGFRVEAIDRTVGEGRESRAYLLRHLPEGNLHPPTASYAARFAAATCPSPT